MENLDKVYARRIAEEYAPKTETKVVRLKKLDEKVKRPPLIFTYTYGIISALILGVGMSLVMTEILPDKNISLPLGIVIGVVGLILCGINYPIYKKMLKSRKQKYAFEINELAKEITEND